MKKDKVVIKNILLIVWLVVCLLLICFCFQGIILGPIFMLEKQVSVIRIIFAEFFFLGAGLFIYFSFIKTCRYLGRHNKYGLMRGSFL